MPILSRSMQPGAARFPSDTGGPSRILSVKRTAAVCRDKLPFAQTERRPQCVSHHPNTSSALPASVLRDFRERKAAEGQGPSLIRPFPSLWPKCLANRWHDAVRKNERQHNHVGICRRPCKAHQELLGGEVVFCALTFIVIEILFLF